MKLFNATFEGAETPALVVRSFWREAFAMKGAITFHVTGNVLIFTALAFAIYLLDRHFPPDLGVDVTTYEIAGVALGLLLVLRTNAGYDRWWEARKLWGGMVNQTRSLALLCVAHGPDDIEWRGQILRWIIAFAHVCRHSLRRERELPELVRLIGDEEAQLVSKARHMPSYVALRIACMLRDARVDRGMDPLMALLAEQTRGQLIDHIGGCERILKTPLPKVYSINIRRFIVIFLGTLPFGLLPKLDGLTPVVVFLVSYPLLALDQIGVELQNPYSTRNLGHLPLDTICDGIERDLLALCANQPFLRGGDGDKVSAFAGV